MSASLECCLKSFVRDVLKKDDKFINFEKDKRTIKEYVSNNKRATIHLYEKKKMNNGMVAEIIKMSSCRNITVQFEDGEIVYHKCYQSFVKGNISHPKDTSLAKKNQRLNIRKQMKNGMMAEVIEYNLSNDIKVKFDNGEIVKTRWERFSTGSVAVPSCYARNHIGDKKIQNRGNEEAEIIEVKDANHITVKFKDGTIVKDRKYEDFIHGAIGKPGIPQLRRTLKNERLWIEKIMRNGMKAKIVRYGSANDIDIKFSNGTIVLHKTYRKTERLLAAENQYKEFKKSGKKPSDFCKENLRMSDVKSYDYVFNYFSNSGILVEAIKEYHRTAKIPKGEYTLLDLLK